MHGVIDYYYYIWKVIIRGLPSEIRAFVYYYIVLVEVYNILSIIIKTSCEQQ